MESGICVPLYFCPHYRFPGLRTTRSRQPFRLLLAPALSLSSTSGLPLTPFPPPPSPPAVWATTSGLRLPVLFFAHNFRSAAPFPLRAAWHSGSCSPLPPQDERRDAAIGSSDFQLVSVTQLPVRGSQPRLRSPLPVWNNNFRSVVVGFGYGLQFGSASPTSCFRLPRCSRSEPRGTLGAAVHFRSALHSGTRDRKF